MGQVKLLGLFIRGHPFLLYDEDLQADVTLQDTFLRLACLVLKSLYVNGIDPDLAVLTLQTVHKSDQGSVITQEG